MSEAAERPRVLVIDDLADELKGSLSYIADEYEFEFAVRGSEGIRRLREDRREASGIFAVLLDNKFEEPEFALEPIYEGREILHQILTIKDPPVVMMISAYDDTDTVVECIQAGAFWYLSKPIDPDRLQASNPRRIAIIVTEGPIDAATRQGPTLIVFSQRAENEAAQPGRFGQRLPGRLAAPRFFCCRGQCSQLPANVQHHRVQGGFADAHGLCSNSSSAARSRAPAAA